jgi:hypothetical protein
MEALLNPLRYAYSFACCHLWDWSHSVKTCGEIPQERLQLPPELRKYSAVYAASHPKLVRQLFDSLPLDTNGRFRLVDFGSGKGRVLLQALGYPFLQIEGIEADPQLHAIAEENLRRYRGIRRCASARSVCMDARSYEYSAANAVYFFYSPFRGPIMDAVLEKLFNSLRTYRRDVFLVYVNPERAKQIDDSGLFVAYSAGKYARVWRSRVIDSTAQLTV